MIRSATTATAGSVIDVARVKNLPSQFPGAMGFRNGNIPASDSDTKRVVFSQEKRAEFGPFHVNFGPNSVICAQKSVYNVQRTLSRKRNGESQIHLLKLLERPKITLLQCFYAQLSTKYGTALDSGTPFANPDLCNACLRRGREFGAFFVRFGAHFDRFRRVWRAGSDGDRPPV
jgi:hypothetical protein